MERIRSGPLMQVPTPTHTPLASLLESGRRLARDESGVTAIEFGLLALPFFSIIAAILETSIIFLASQLLDSAVQDSSRLVLTGQVQSAGYSAAQYKTAVCNNLYGLFDCTKLKVRVHTLDSFSSATITSPVVTSGTTAGQWNITEDYDTGGAGSVVMVEAYYKWPIILAFGGFSLQNMPDGTRLLGSVRVFRNEPFS